MANKTATLKVTVAYQAPGGGTVQVQMNPLSVPYQAQTEGTIDVPDTTPASTSFPIPFGSIGTGATLLLVVNKSGQPLTLSLNGGDLEQPLGDQEFAIVELGSDVTGTPVTAAAVETTDIQAGAGSVDFFVFGDPT